MSKKNTLKRGSKKTSIVLYCLIRRKSRKGDMGEFLLITKQGHPTFPPTKFRPGENLYSAMIRPMAEDLGLPEGSFFLEEELPMIPSAGESIRYPGLTKEWHLYPVVVSLTTEGMSVLENMTGKQVRGEGEACVVWWTLDSIRSKAEEPNVLAIAGYLYNNRADLLSSIPSSPSMDALASDWAAKNSGGVRIANKKVIERILDAGSRAFNLRVADPYLPYQKQGLGFTWSFFTPKDKQDVHVHGLPAVEIYGILEGRLQIWHKPMNNRGVRTWKCRTLEAGDWAEVEPLHCHFACWLDPEGLGTVVKAAGSGELAGVGKLGVSGKTTCEYCNVKRQCIMHPNMEILLDEYKKDIKKRDYEKIAAIAEEGEEIR